MSVPSTPPDTSLPDAQELIGFIETRTRGDAMRREQLITMLTEDLHGKTLHEFELIKIAVRFASRFVKAQDLEG